MAADGCLVHTEAEYPGVPLTFEDAQRLIGEYVQYYNTVRLHAGIGYVTPADRLHQIDDLIHRQRDEKLEAARERRRLARQAERANQPTSRPCPRHSSSTIDFASLRRDVSMRDVLAGLGGLEAYQGWAAQERGPCPIYPPDDGKRHPSFSVHLDRGIYRWFHPECQAQLHFRRSGCKVKQDVEEPSNSAIV